jgi:hypothetical protein
LILLFMQSEMGLTEVEQYATHPVDTILQRENQVPGTNDRIDTLSIVWGPNSWGMKIGLHEKQKMLKVSYGALSQS